MIDTEWTTRILRKNTWTKGQKTITLSTQLNISCLKTQVANKQFSVFSADSSTSSPSSISRSWSVPDTVASVLMPGITLVRHYKTKKSTNYTAGVTRPATSRQWKCGVLRLQCMWHALQCSVQPTNLHLGFWFWFYWTFDFWNFFSFFCVVFEETKNVMRGLPWTLYRMFEFATIPRFDYMSGLT